MATECTRQVELFSIGKRAVTMRADGRLTSSDAGVVLLSRIDTRLGLSEGIAKTLTDGRDSARVQHTNEDLVRQRILQIACGYEDANDATTLRHDPLFQTALGRVADRAEGALASQPTLSRFEQRSWRELLELSELLVESWLDRECALRGKRSRKTIVLDFDTTDDATHGAQQLSMFNGYYDQYMYHPLLVFDEKGFPVAMVLRPGNAHASHGVAAILERIVEKIRQRLPKATIIMRADAGFATPEIYKLCEDHGLGYIIGQVPHKRYYDRIESLLDRAREEYARDGNKARLLMEFEHKAHTWPRKRRVIAKVEVSKEGENRRFVLTNLEGDPEQDYQFYLQRGQSENFIKELKNAMFADRLSCTDFRANQFRLLLHTAAYILLYEFRSHLAGTVLERAQMDTLRLKLIKIGVTVRVTARRIWVQLSEFHPSAAIFMDLSAKLSGSSP